MRVIGAAIVLWAASAVAGPLKLEPHPFGDMTIRTPAGWTYAANAEKHVATATQDPKNPNAPQLMVVFTAARSEDEILEAFSSKVPNAKVLRRGPGPNHTGTLFVLDGDADNVRVRMGAIAVVADGTGAVAALVAPVGQFDGLGGIDLAIEVLTSLQKTAAAPPPATPTTPTTLPAGRYACQQMRYTVNSPPTYVPTGISFDLDGKGGYNAPSFKGGPGTVTLDGTVLTFHGGSMNGWHGVTGTISSGPFVRIRMKDPTAVAVSLQLGDGMCYLTGSG